MKTFKSILFYGALVGSVILCAICFKYASENRVSDVMGGEVFMLALPLLVVKLKLWAVEEHEKKRKRRMLKVSRKIIKQYM